MKCLQGEISEKDGMINKERQVHQQGLWVKVPTCHQARGAHMAEGENRLPTLSDLHTGTVARASLCRKTIKKCDEDWQGITLHLCTQRYTQGVDMPTQITDRGDKTHPLSFQTTLTLEDAVKSHCHWRGSTADLALGDWEDSYLCRKQSVQTPLTWWPWEQKIFKANYLKSLWRCFLVSQVRAHSTEWISHWVKRCIIMCGRNFMINMNIDMGIPWALISLQPLSLRSH